MPAVLVESFGSLVPYILGGPLGPAGSRPFWGQCGHGSFPVWEPSTTWSGSAGAPHCWGYYLWFKYSRIRQSWGSISSGQTGPHDLRKYMFDWLIDWLIHCSYPAMALCDYAPSGETTTLGGQEASPRTSKPHAVFKSNPAPHQASHLETCWNHFWSEKSGLMQGFHMAVHNFDVYWMRNAF